MFNAKQVKEEIVQWVREYFSLNGNPATKAVIGISGGKDSSIVAAICVEALGKDRVLGVLLPDGVQEDINIAYALCKHLDIEHIEININSVLSATYEELTKGDVELYPIGNPNPIVFNNTPARIRMAMLYAISGAVGGRVANTSNLSEEWVGYSTKYGDGVGDFSPLYNLTVTEVKKIGQELGLPSIFIDKVPVDGLCGQTDEANLGFSYDTLDVYIRKGINPDLQTKAKIDKLHKASRHKIYPMASYKLSK